MSEKHFLLKPQFIIAGVILVALIGLSSTLKQQVEGPARSDDRAESTEFDRMDTGGTRITGLNAPSISSSGSGPRTAQRAPAQARQSDRRQITEDFDAAVRRAEGDSQITGRIVASNRDQPADETAEAGEGSERGERGRRGGMRSWRERWDDVTPLPKATVQLFEGDPNTTHPAIRTVETDEEGNFVIDKINASNQRYIIVARADNYAPEATFVRMRNEPVEVNVRLEEGFPVRGKVLDAETSRPVAGAVVYHPNPNRDPVSVLGVTTTTAMGEFYFPAVQPGRRLMTQAAAEGYATKQERLRSPDEDAIVYLQPGGSSISGVTIDRLTGKPQGGARVWVRTERRWSGNVEKSVISAPDGTFTVTELPEGNFDVFAVRGMRSEAQSIELGRNQNVDNIEITLPAPMLVSGQVIHATQRTPLPGVKVWYESGKGAQYKETNADGQFAFDTMAIDEYAILIHEKGFLPVGDGSTTDSEETITRKITRNQASDELTIRLRPVPTLEGKVLTEGRRGGEGTPAAEAEVKLSYLEGRDFTELSTKSDAAGNFFINLPKGERGEGIVMASKNFMLDGKDVRIPAHEPIELTLSRNISMGRLLLTDESSLDGVPVGVSVVIPKNRPDSSVAQRVLLSSVTTMRGGMLMMGLPPDQEIDLTFALPDGQVIHKNFQSDRLLNSRPIFVYDPVSQDVIADTTPSQRGGWGGRRRGGGPGGPGGPRGGDNNRPGNQQPQQPAGEAPGSPPPAAAAQ